ncbi:hypothetical protein FKW77_007153 [Venturia effusa]|uniref:Uncharacterized protein n=1 Tax=Venturia effusa TaxID=50376 RepID=A0A517L3M1_9PEZI|nr:hypothetical protein FKW77_007153 [Venturia effusa]
MPISWTPDAHETLLFSIFASAAHKGAPPSFSALSQHIAGLKKKVKVGAGSTTKSSAATTPVPRSKKAAATGTFGSAPKSRGRQATNTLFSGSASKANHRADVSDDSEGEDGDASASADSPTPATGRQSLKKGSALGKRRRSEEEDELDDLPIRGPKPTPLLDQLRAAAGKKEEKMKREPVWSSESL